MNATYILPLSHKPNFHGYLTWYWTHILHHMSISDDTSHNWIHIILFLLSFRWHCSEINFNGWFWKLTKTYKFCAHTHWYLFHSEYPVQWIEHSLTYECPNHMSVRLIKPSWIRFSFTVTWIAMTGTDGIKHPDVIGQAGKGHSLISQTMWTKHT